jgi:putative tricarboxylic transport membrane protein
MEKEEKMGWSDRLSSAFWFLCGGVIVYGSNRLGLGTLMHPGPGFLPFWCGVMLAGLSLVVFLRGKGQALRSLWVGVRWHKGVYIIMALVVYSLTFMHVGFILSTVLLLIFLFKAVEPQRWAVAVGGAILTSLVCFVVFGLWLDVQLPRGMLEKLFF